MQRSVEIYSLFTDFDVSLFQAGKHHKLYEKFGSHALLHNGNAGTYFAVWAPNADSVSVIGNFSCRLFNVIKVSTGFGLV